jgi:hypothetical protein
LLEIYYLTHINLVSDYEYLLDEFLDPDLVLDRRQLYEEEVEYQRTHVAQPEEDEPMEEDLEEELGDDIVEDGVVSETNLESPTPYEPFVAREGHHINNYGWEVLDTYGPIVPMGWGMNDKDLPCYDVETEPRDGRTQWQVIDLRQLNLSALEGEINLAKFMAEIALCLEALQSCQEATTDQSRSSDEEMTPLTYYYMEDGRPFYPDMKREEPWLLEIDAGGSMYIRNIKDRLEEMFKSLDSFFVGSEMEKEPVVDPTHALPKPVVLPGNLRSSTRFNGY